MNNYNLDGKNNVIVSLNTIEKVKTFVTKISDIDCECDLVSESRRYVIDAKSIMGIFSLDLSKSLILHIHAEENDPVIDKVRDAIKDYIVVTE